MQDLVLTLIQKVNDLHVVVNRPKNCHQKAMLFYGFSVDAHFYPDSMPGPDHDEVESSYVLNTHKDAKLIKLLQNVGMKVDDEGYLPPTAIFEKH